MTPERQEARGRAAAAERRPNRRFPRDAVDKTAQLGVVVTQFTELGWSSPDLVSQHPDVAPVTSAVERIMDICRAGGGGIIDFRRLAGYVTQHPQHGIWETPLTEPARQPLTRERLLLGQLKRNEETKIGAVLADPLAVDLLDYLSGVRRARLEDLAKRLRSPRQWVAFAKLVRADLLREAADSFVLTSVGKKTIGRWRTVAAERAP